MYGGRRHFTVKCHRNGKEQKTVHLGGEEVEVPMLWQQNCLRLSRLPHTVRWKQGHCGCALHKDTKDNQKVTGVPSLSFAWAGPKSKILKLEDAGICGACAGCIEAGCLDRTLPMLQKLFCSR